MPNTIKAIIFDNHGVLQLGKYSLVTFRRHRDLSVHHFMAKSFHINLDQWFDAIDTPYADAIVGKIAKEQALHIMAKNLDTTPKHLEHLFIKAYKKHFRRNNILHRVAFRLKRKGYKIAILSDQWPVSKEALISKEDLKKFNEAVISCDVKYRKPVPVIYHVVLKRLGVLPHEAVFIDNQKWNILPARHLGMHAILFSNNWQTLRALRKLGVKL